MTGTAFVVNADGTSRPVRNLGWLLRHAAEVERLEFHVWDDRTRWDGTFRAWLTGGRLFECRWADIGLWRQWIERRRFSGVTAATYRGLIPQIREFIVGEGRS